LSGVIVREYFIFVSAKDCKTEKNQIKTNKKGIKR